MAVKATAWAWRQDRRTPVEKLALIAISDGICTTETIARFCCANIHQTTQALEALTKDGIIVQETIHGWWYFAAQLRQELDQEEPDGRG